MRSGFCSRRHFLLGGTMGIAHLGLLDLLGREGLLAAPIKPELAAHAYDVRPKPTHFAPKAKAMISLMMIGGPSHIDLFEPKPEIVKHDGKPYPGDLKIDNPAQFSPKILAPFWKFVRYGQCGMEMSELLPHLGGIADLITLVRSTRTAVNNHVQSLCALNTGRIQTGHPALGSWLTYGLGTENQNLPAFMALTHPSGSPLVAGENWSNGWLPSVYQGTPVRPKEPRIPNLDPPPELRGKAQDRQLELLRELNNDHAQERPGENDLQARMASYELAARMQTAAKEALDISGETEETLKLYGIDQSETKDWGTRCLIARRLVERGVRYVQVFNNGQSWDHHGNMLTALPALCKQVDKPCAALVSDLKRIGLLDSTVVHWGGEMGRLPVIQNDVGRDKVGRDHNTYGFTMWLAGGGFKGGYVHGATDDFGYQAVQDIVTHHDYHATLLHLFGLDHTKLTYKRNGQELSLVNGAPAKVVQELLA